MGFVHKFKGDERNFDWEGVFPHSYEGAGARGVIKRVLIGEREGAPFFVMRYFEVEKGGYTSLDEHEHDHGVFVMRGKGKVLLGEKEFDIERGDVVYVPCQERHQFKNTGEDPLGFICVIASKKVLEKFKGGE